MEDHRVGVAESPGLSWERDGVAVLRGVLDETLVADLRAFTAELEADAAAGGGAPATGIMPMALGSIPKFSA